MNGSQETDCRIPPEETLGRGGRVDKKSRFELPPPFTFWCLRTVTDWVFSPDWLTSQIAGHKKKTIHFDLMSLGRLFLCQEWPLEMKLQGRGYLLGTLNLALLKSNPWPDETGISRLIALPYPPLHIF